MNNFMPINLPLRLSGQILWKTQITKSDSKGNRKPRYSHIYKEINVIKNLSTNKTPG